MGFLFLDKKGKFPVVIGRLIFVVAAMLFITTALLAVYIPGFYSESIAVLFIAPILDVLVSSLWGPIIWNSHYRYYDFPNPVSVLNFSYFFTGVLLYLPAHYFDIPVLFEVGLFILYTSIVFQHIYSGKIARKRKSVSIAPHRTI